MGDFYDLDPTAVLNLVAEWEHIASEEAMDIEGWRDAAGKRTEYVGDPSREWGPKPSKFRRLTLRLSNWIVSHYPNLNPTPLHDIYLWVTSWHEDHNASRIPDQATLYTMLDRARFVTCAIRNNVSVTFVL